MGKTGNSTGMDAALERLTAGLVDYAGTFPPASLSPEAALAELRGHLEGPERRLLRALAWPASKLDLLAQSGLACEVTAIGSPQDPSRGEGWDVARTADAQALTRFARELPEGIELMAYECVLPSDRPIEAALDALSGFAGVEVYVEVADAEPLPLLSERDWASAKMRAAGIAPATLAAFLHGCVSLELPFKLTAGLHAPYTDEKGIGFLNTLAATALALADDLTPTEIEVILRLPNGTWRALAAEEADDARALFDAIGSCSLADIARGVALVA